MLIRPSVSVTFYLAVCLACTRDISSCRLFGSPPSSPPNRPYHIGLFCSTGAYSHDMMMRRLAEQLAASGHRVTLLQIRVFAFNYTILPIASDRVTVVQLNCTSAATSELMGRLQNQIWYSTVPFGNRRLSYRSISLFAQLYEAHMDGCRVALNDRSFLRRVLRLRLDLVIVDYLLNECALAISVLTRAPRIYLSNFPMMESYVDSTGVASNPAFVPSVLSKEMTPMAFLSRTSNSICRLLAVLWRRKLMWSMQNLLRGHRLLPGTDDAADPDLWRAEHETLLFFTPSEFLLDVPRPLTHGTKYLGCCQCLNQSKGSFAKTFKVTPRKGVILVSFGTTPNAKRMPRRVIDTFRSIFAGLKQYSVVFQLPDVRQVVPGEFNFTSNVMVADWIPLSQLLGDPSVSLFITHGGISSMMEAIGHAVPILGIPLQGDQFYNLGRLVERGMADVIAVEDLTVQRMSDKLLRLLGDAADSSSFKPDTSAVGNVSVLQSAYSQLQKYRQTAASYKSMLQSFHAFHHCETSGTESEVVYWIDWALRHFRLDNASQSAHFLRVNFPRSLFRYFLLDCMAALLIVVVCCQFLLM